MFLREEIQNRHLFFNTSKELRNFQIKKGDDMNEVLYDILIILLMSFVHEIGHIYVLKILKKPFKIEPLYIKNFPIGVTLVSLPEYFTIEEYLLTITNGIIFGIPFVLLSINKGAVAIAYILSCCIDWFQLFVIFYFLSFGNLSIKDNLKFIFKI